MQKSDPISILCPQNVPYSVANGCMFNQIMINSQIYDRFVSGSNRAGSDRTVNKGRVSKRC